MFDFGISEIGAGPLEGKFLFTFSKMPPTLYSHPKKELLPSGRKPTMLLLADFKPFYVAKCHESFIKGLKKHFDVSHYGRGHPGYFETRRLREVIKNLYKDDQPDMIFSYAENDHELGIGCFKQFDDIAEYSGITCIMIGDFWNLHPKNVNTFANYIIDKNINIIATYFPHTFYFLYKTEIADRVLYILPTIDPAIFNDWKTAKKWDVGFLAAGTTEYSPYYPERYKLHAALLAQRKYTYLFADHPAKGKGTFNLQEPHRLVGKGFSLHINACRGFLNSGGIYRTPNSRTVEILASASVLFSFNVFDCDFLRLEDGKNYVCIDENNALDKIEYYLSHPELCQNIITSGYNTAMEFHTGERRALEFKEMLVKKDSHAAYAG